MNRIELENTKLTVTALAELAKEGTVILTRKGKPFAAVKPIPGSDWESVSLANNPRFLALIEEARQSYRDQAGISLEEIRAEFGLTKKRPRQAKPRHGK